MAPKDAAPGSHSQTLSRGIQLLEVLAESEQSMSIADLALALDLHRSIVYRSLRTLEDHGLVQRDSSGSFLLGARMAFLSRNVASGLKSAVQPRLSNLANKYGITFFLSVLDHNECITLLTAEPANATAAVVQRPGSKHSIAVGAPGLAIQAILTDAEWPGITEKIDLRPEIKDVEKNGYATSHDEVIKGVSSIAVPLRASGIMPAAIAAVYITDTVKEAAVRKDLMACRDEIVLALN